MDRPKEIERALRQSAVGLTKWSGEAAMEPVFLLLQGGNYREATTALIEMVADRTVVVQRWHEHVLLRAAVAYGVDPAPLRNAQTLPDWPHLEEFGFLLDHVIDWLEDRLPDGKGEQMRQTHRCGEGGIVVGELVAYIDDGNIELTTAEQLALQMLRYEADTGWFKYRVASGPPTSLLAGSSSRNERNPVEEAHALRLSRLRSRRDRLIQRLAEVNAEIDEITDGDARQELVDVSSPDWSALVRYLQELHLGSGEPSSRKIAKGSGGLVSHTTVSETLRGTRMPTWKTLRVIGLELGADEPTLKQIWVSCQTSPR